MERRKKYTVKARVGAGGDSRELELQDRDRLANVVPFHAGVAK